MTEPTQPTELSTLEDLLAAFDRDAVLELMSAADLPSADLNVRLALFRLATVLRFDVDVLIARRDALSQPEPEAPIEPESED